MKALFGKDRICGVVAAETAALRKEIATVAAETDRHFQRAADFAMPPIATSIRRSTISACGRPSSRGPSAASRS